MDREAKRNPISKNIRPKSKYTTEDWVGRMNGVPCFLLGNGPSIGQENLSLLTDYFTIGINRILLLFDPTVLLWQDLGLWNSEYKSIHNSQAIKIARDIADPQKLFYNYKSVGGRYKFDKTKTHEFSGSGSTGAIGIQLANALGCEPIYLMGCDCKIASDGRTDFWGKNTNWYSHTLTNCEEGLKAAKKDCPAPIISLSNNDFWDRQSLNDVIKTIDPIHKIGRQAYVKKLLNH